MKTSSRITLYALILVVAGTLFAPVTSVSANSKTCDFYSNVGRSHLDYYWDETVTEKTIHRPELILAVHIDGRQSEFIRVMYADEMLPGDLECHVGGQAQYWEPFQEGHYTAWRYNAPEAHSFNVLVGRLQVSAEHEVTAEYPGSYSTSSATWRPVSRDDTTIPLKPPPDVNQSTGDSCPNTPEEVSQVFNGHLPTSSFNGPVEDGGFVYSGDPVSFTVAEGVTVVSPHGTFTSGQAVSETDAFTIYFNCS